MRGRMLIALSLVACACGPGDSATAPPSDLPAGAVRRNIGHDDPSIQRAGNATLVCTFNVAGALVCTATDPDGIEIVEVIASTTPVVLEQRIVPKPACPLTVVFFIAEGFPLPHRHVVTVIDCQRRTGRDDFTINREGGVRRVRPGPRG
ncbi:MAG: hypothetical protein ACT4P7_13810 [Gemmatimonadaceae bacterium]